MQMVTTLTRLPRRSINQRRVALGWRPSATGAWDMAATLVAGGATVAWLDQITSAVGEDMLEPAVRWLRTQWTPNCS
jgi:hypothetical protein